MSRQSRIFMLRTMLFAAILLLAAYPASFAQPPVLPTAFTYQGYLENALGPVNGVCTFQFSLFDDPIAGTQIGTTNTLVDLPISGGVFTATLDFGAAAFTGGTRYLAIAVTCPGDAGFTALTPRQAITPAPYSTYAATAGSVDWSSILNLPPGFADGVDNEGSGSADLSAYYLLDGTRALTANMNAGGNQITNLAPATNTGQALTFDQAIKPGDAAGGDLLGTYPAPTIGSIRGNPVSAVAPATNDVLVWNGAQWTPVPLSGGGTVDLTPYYVLNGSRALTGNMNTAGNRITNLPLANGSGQPIVYQQGVKVGDAAGGDLSGAYPAPTINALQGNPLNVASPNPNDVLLWNGGTWVAAPISSAAGWQLNGNVGTTAANFLGTTDNQSLRFRVNNQIAMLIVPNAVSPNLIGGYSGNSITTGAAGSVIGGGGGNPASVDPPNVVTDNFSVVSGGSGNTAGNGNALFNDADYTTVAGGGGNIASDDYATVGGGQNNTSSNLNSVVAGGFSNMASGTRSTVGGGQSNSATNQFSAVAGGAGNDATGTGTFVGGGRLNTASGPDSAIGGGSSNLASATGNVIAGGESNETTSNYAAVLGGLDNLAAGLSSVIGGGESNEARDNYSMVLGGVNNTAGGNDASQLNQVYAIVVGGLNNVASDERTFVGGGSGNVASGTGGFVGGGQNNSATGDYSTVGGGSGNSSGGPAGASLYTFVGGGIGNLSEGLASFVGGGDGNSAVGGHSAIAGGQDNEITNQGLSSFIGGGDTNTVSGGLAVVAGGNDNTADDDYAAIVGGDANTASGPYSFVGGGQDNGATDNYSTVSGGDGNSATDGWATVSGGQNNSATGSGATVPGGVLNTAQGNYSLAAGYNTGAATGAFVWGGGASATQLQAPSNTFVANAPSGFWFGDNRTPSFVGGRLINTSSGAYLTTGGTWTNSSDINKKTNFESVDSVDVLEALVNIPITTWSYLEEVDNDVRRIGPMAQDFHAAFGVGADNTHISTVDADGVAFAAIQGLYEVVSEKDSRISDLEAENALLQAQNASFEARLDALEANTPAGNAMTSVFWLIAGGLVMAGRVSVLRRREV